MDISSVKCPHCEWSPPKGTRWHCLECSQDFNHFDNLGRCPNCGYNHDKTYCIEEMGGCGRSTSHLEWYGDFDRGLRELDIFNL